MNKNYAHVITFKVRGKLALIHSLIQKGLHIDIDSKCEYACAGFDNISDYNDFNNMLANLPA